MASKRDGGTGRSESRWQGAMSRRGLLKLGAVTTAAIGATKVATSFDASEQVAAHNLPQGQFGSPLYDQAINAEGGVKGVFQSPNIEAAAPAGKTLNHLLLVQLKNWLNGFQFSYQMKPEDLHTVVATYASANLLTYNDAMWERYHLGEKYNIIDPATGAPSIRNLFWPSRFDANNMGNPDDPQSFYQDTGIEALQKRGTVFLT